MLKVDSYLKYIIVLILFMLIMFIILNYPVNNGRVVFVNIKHGWTFHSVANYLSKNSLIRSRFFFLINSRFFANSKRLQTGIYRISDSYSTLKIISIINKGKTASKIFTIPEGYNIYQIAKMLDDKKIISEEKFLRLCHSKKIQNKYNIKTDTVEGFLFPDTYYVLYNISEEKLLEIMINNFFKNVNKLYLKRMKEVGYSLNEMVTLASLVEWEAQIDFERPIIASVFLNRLKKGLNLSSCATVQYALGKHKSRLMFKDLKADSPYNTYRYKGLPPTPICNPGINSILAVLFPAKTDYLFFVSEKNGRHYFAKTYREHLEAYRKYILDD